MFIKTATGLTAPNGNPSGTSGASSGVAITGRQVGPNGQYLPGGETEVVVGVVSTAGTTPTATVALWGYAPEANLWFRFKVLNAGAAIAATGTNTINYGEAVTGARHFTRLYVELTAISGAATAIDLYIFQTQTKENMA